MIIAITVQHENWDDDGGDHNCFLIDTDLIIKHVKDGSELVKRFENDDNFVVDIETAEALNQRCRVNPPQFVEMVKNIWYKW